MARKKKIKTTFFKDFKTFIAKGNVIDMAVGVVIGSAFSKIVSGLVSNILNPCIAFITSNGVSLSDLKYVITEEVEATETTEAVAEVAIRYGEWFQSIIDFLLTAFWIFFVLRIIMIAKNAIEAKKIAEEKEAAAAAKAKADADAAALKARQKALEEAELRETKVLEEIRDLLSVIANKENQG